MNNLDLIIEKILSEAKSEGEAIIASANSAISQINEETLKGAEAIVADTKLRSEKEASVTIQRAEGSALMKCREVLLKTKVQLIDQAFQLALEKLTSLPPEEYIELLSNLIADAIRERLENVAEMKELYGEDEDNDYCTTFSVIFNAADRKAYSAEATKAAKAILKKRMAITVEKECADICGGVIVRYGDIETNCSLEAVIASARAACEAKVAEMLFSA